MKPSDPLELELASTPRELAPVRASIRRWTRREGWKTEQIADIVLAVDEALTNVIRHAYGGAAQGRILLRIAPICDPVRGEGLEVCIRDFGKQVDPSRIRGRDLNELRPGGLGVHIIRAMMENVEYTCAPEGGMQLVMRKYKTEPDKRLKREAEPE